MIDRQHEKPLEESIYKVFTNLKLNYYNTVFKILEERKGDLTIIETICVEAIYELNEPTINELAKFINISQPNAAYKVANLVRKGYVRKQQCEDDRRSYRLLVTDKFLKYYAINHHYIKTLAERLEKNVPKEKLDVFEEVLTTLGNELMPEVTEFQNKFKR